ncbi:hypothetical protein [Flavobacterium sp. 3-210]
MKNILVTLILILLTSCKNKNFDEKVFEDVSNTHKLEIDLKDYTDFEWDTVYIFHKISNLEYIESIIGKRYNNYEEFTRPIIFMKKGKIIYTENRNSNFEGLENEQLVHQNSIYSIKDNANSKFKVKIEQRGNIKFLLISD